MDFLVQFLAKASHRMVFVSVISLFIYLISIFFYTKIYPKKKLSYLILLLGFSILPVISIFRTGSYESGDLTINVAKLMSFYSNLEEGNLTPRWSGELNATYGYPNFIFAYPLPYYLSSIYHFIGLNFLNSIKLLLITSYTASGLTMYIYLKNHVKERYAFLGSIFYLYAPYHLVDLHFRVDIGEIIAMVFLPLSLYFVDTVIIKSEFLWQFLLGLSITFLILSHQAVSLLAFPLIISYSIFLLIKYKKVQIKTFTGIIFGLLLSSYYWVPILIEGKFTHQMTEISRNPKYLSLTDLLYSKWRCGLLFQGPHGELSFLLGYANLLVLFVLFFLIIRKKCDQDSMFFTISFITYLTLTMSISRPIWTSLSILRKIQFPYRILSILIFIVSILSASITEKLNSNKVWYLLITVCITTSILNWGNRKNLPIVDDKWVQDRLPLTTSMGEGLLPAAPVWIPKDEVWQSEIPTQQLEVIKGKLKIISENRSIERHHYEVLAFKNSLLRENTYFFPGWELKIDGENQDFDYQNPSFPGIFFFPVSEGYHTIDLNFTNTTARKFSLLTSFITFFISGVLLILPVSAAAAAEAAAGKPSPTGET